MAFHVDWFSGHIPVWKKMLKGFKNKPNLLFLEIGTYEGHATLWLVQNILTHPSSKIVVVDTFKGSMEHSKGDVKNLLLDFQENLAPYIFADPNKSKVIINQGLSGEIIRTFGFKSKFDFIYVDGSQVAKEVLEDIILGWRLLKNQGIMILNDYGWRIYNNPLLRPDLAINSFLSIFHKQYEILHIGYQVVIQKKGDNIEIPKKFNKNIKNKFIFPDYDLLRKLQTVLDLSNNTTSQLQQTIKRLTKENNTLNLDLKKIQNAKLYKIWQRYCNCRKFLKTLLLKSA